MTSQLLGMVVAAGAGGSEKDQEVAGWVTGIATANNYLEHIEVEKLEGELIGCRYNPDPAVCRENVKNKFQVISDSKTGASLYNCKKNGEAACADQLAGAQSDSASLDWLVGSSKLSSEERDIIEHFQDINHADDRVAYDPWKQTFWQESGAAGVVLRGVAGGIGAADRAAAAYAYAEGKLSVELINSTMQPYKAGQVISNGGRGVTKHAEYFGFEIRQSCERYIEVMLN
ncbi:hypothetical protein [Pseudomonas sp. R1-15]|uniref:hypothetical protein n=1 Tax=Pseudomonas sp. R1-15 TaxID=2817399 RepID=UPI003DA9E106